MLFAPWEPLLLMRDGRFSQDTAGVVCSGWKIYMVNLCDGDAKEGAMFELVVGRWEGMAPGMLAGWKGPAAASPHNAYDWGFGGRGKQWTRKKAEDLDGSNLYGGVLVIIFYNIHCK